MSSKSRNPLINYFSEFGVLKECGKDFWLTNFIQFFDGLSYFTLIIVFALFLKDYCGFRDADAPYWVGMYTLFLSLFAFAVGTICDIIGLKRTYLIGFTMLIAGRIIMGMGSDFGIKVLQLSQDNSRFIVIFGLGVMAFGTAFMSPCITTSIRRFTTLRARPTGFNFYYLFMNIGAFLAGFAIVDPIRHSMDAPYSFQAVVNFGTACNVIAFIFTRFINEDFYAVPEERIAKTQAAQRRPMQLIGEVIREKPFQKLLVFLFLTLGVRLVFSLQFQIMPQYYTRTIGEDFDLGFMNSLNPFIIITGLIVLVPILNKFSTVKLMIWGMSISAFSMVLMAVPPEWYFIFPGIETISQAYFVAIFLQIVIFALGEVLFSPRFSEYIARVASKDKVASYMALAGLPTFISKPLNGVLGGLLVSHMCYEGIAAKMDTGHVSFFSSPECMWGIYLIIAVISPLAIILTKDSFVSDRMEDDATRNTAEPQEAPADNAQPQEA